MITLGFNIKDIVTFMTSPVANFIDTITDTDIFNNTEISINDAYNLASGDFSSLLKGTDIIEMLKYDYPDIKDIDKLIKSGNIPEEIDLSKYDVDTIDTINTIREIKSLMNFNPNLSEVKQDIEEFKNIMNGANEFSNYARVLGINQGIKTSKGDLQTHIQFLQSLTINAAKAKGFKESDIPAEFRHFDLISFVNNVEYTPGKFYRDELIKYYNSIKQCINIFDHIDKIDQFRAIFQIEAAVLQFDQNISVKTKIYDNIYAILKENKGNNYISDQYLTRLVRTIDNNLIIGYFQTKDIRIPIREKDIIYDKFGNEHIANESGLLRLDSLESLATFKNLMETVVIPELKNGNYYQFNGNTVQKVTNDTLTSNKFVQGLIRANDHGVPFYKCDLNMLTIDNSAFSQITYSNYVAGLQALSNIKVSQDLSLADLFTLYNLIINKNNYGADRMTTILDGLLKEENSLSLIKDYLDFVGNLDYFGQVSRDPQSSIITVTADIPGKESVNFQIDYRDNLISASQNVNTLRNQKEPSIILIDSDGHKTFYIKEGAYRAYDLYPELGDSGNQRINRLNNLKRNFVLGGYIKSKIDTTLKSLNSLDDNTLNTIQTLIQEQIMNILTHCD